MQTLNDQTPHTPLFTGIVTSGEGCYVVTVFDNVYLSQYVLPVREIKTKFRSGEFASWARDHRPIGNVADDSRESIY